MKSLLKMTIIEGRLFLREPVGTFFTLGFPLMILFVFGSIFGNAPVKEFGGQGTVDISVPAYTAMIIGTVGLVGLPISVTSYRENGVLRRLHTTPVNPLIILVAHVIVLFVMALVGMALMIISGSVFYHLRFEGNAFSVLAGFILSILSFFSVGFILAGLMPTARTAQTVGMVLLYPMLFLSGAGYPRELLPETIIKISNFLPLTYVVTLLRGLWVGDPWRMHLPEVLVLAGILVVGAFVSVVTFRWE